MHAFKIFSWHSPFLPNFIDYVCAVTNNTPGQSVIILPHDRPRRYITELFAQKKSLAKPLLLPRMITMKEVIDLYCNQNTSIMQNATLLDQLFLLFQSVQQICADDHNNIGQHFAKMDLAHFLPWGIRLASLFEDYLFANLTIQNIYHTEGEVSAQAAALLSSLGKIHQHYRTLLQENKWTTPGLSAMYAAASSDIPRLFDIKANENKHVFIASFLAPHQSETVILKQLWQKGAHICLQSDPNLVTTFDTKSKPTKEMHWSCTFHARIIKKWNAKCELYQDDKHNSPKTHFVSGYDVHSQLLSVKELLSSDDVTANTESSTAIVLTKPSLLIPMLHHLPNKDFNISMGYPLEKSSLFTLLDFIVTLHSVNVNHDKSSDLNDQTSQHNIKYYWRSFLHCIRHPYIQMLKSLPTQTKEAEVKGQPIRPILQHMEKILRHGSRFIKQQDIIDKTYNELGAKPDITWDLVNDLFYALLDNFANVTTPKQLAQAIMHLCQLLLNYGYEIWENAPLNAEALYRLMQRVIPMLMGSALANEHMPRATLFALMQQLIQAERVPFQAYPITGLQVLGLLETRLLHFERVIIVDATDDALPGFASQDPLLPDALRHTLGLPDSALREQVIAHSLYALMASAKHVHFFWQEGIGRSSLFDDKKSRSRFIDTAIWKEERELGYVLKNNDGPLNTVPCVVYPIERKPQEIEISSDMRKQVLQILTHGISPTALDTYIQCPQRFAWQYIYKLKPLEEVNEDYNPLAVGKLLHDILHKIYKPLEGTNVYQANLDTDLVDDYFYKCLSKADLQLPPDSLMMLQIAAPLRLKWFLQNQPELTHILALEKTLHAPVTSLHPSNANQVFMLKGILDRIDLRNFSGKKQAIILDYKTGKLPKIKRDIWEDDTFWHDIKLCTKDNANTLLMSISENFSSLQLPCYIQLCAHNYKYPIFDASWVNLAESGKEFALLGDDLEEDLRHTIITECIPQLLSFVLNHMSMAQTFAPCESNNCQFCSYHALCFK